MLPVQCKMARVALNLGIRDLAEIAKVSPDTVARFERGELLRERTLDALRSALENAGAEFRGGGVALRPFRVGDRVKFLPDRAPGPLLWHATGEISAIEDASEAGENGRRVKVKMKGIETGWCSPNDVEFAPGSPGGIQGNMV